LKIPGFYQYDWGRHGEITLKFTHLHKIVNWLLDRVHPPVVTIDFPMDNGDYLGPGFPPHASDIHRNRAMDFEEALAQVRKNLRVK
jgi:hypothetical protein